MRRCPWLAPGDTVEQGGTTGVVGNVNGNTVELSSSSGTWTDGDNVVGPEKEETVAGTTKYLKFDSNGNVSDLLDAPQDPPVTTTDESPSLTLTFPSTFPSGEAPTPNWLTASPSQSRSPHTTAVDRPAHSTTQFSPTQSPQPSSSANLSKVTKSSQPETLSNLPGSFGATGRLRLEE